MSLRPSLRLRPARSDDREAVMAFATHTWDWGDYLAWVWDDWLADPTGLFMVGEVDGAIAGVDKLTFVAPGEAFFEGLRINPAYRGRGFAQAFQTHMLEEAKAQGAHVVRLLTAADNTPIHHMSERDGFQRGPALVPWNAKALEAGAEAVAVPEPYPPSDMPPFRTPHSAFQMAKPCIAHHWHVQAWTLEFWDAQIAAGAVWTTPHGLLGFVSADPGDDTLWLAWLHPTTPAHLPDLLRAARHQATPDRALQLMLPDDPATTEALRAAGWEADATHSYLVFEKTPL